MKLQSQHITTQGMVGFLLAFVFTIPLMFVHTTKIRRLFSVKSVILPLAGLGIVCWATAANGGVSADNLVDKSVRMSTAVFAWGIIAQFDSVMGANSALLVTVPDLARYSKTKRAQLYGQALGLPLSQTICAASGIITTVSEWARSIDCRYMLNIPMTDLLSSQQLRACTANHTGTCMIF